MSATHPLARLIGHARAYRRDVWLASLYSVLNKFFDVLPEVLMGVAVDVVVNRKDSFLARVGVHEPKDQLVLLAAVTALIWVGESLFQYLYDVKWRTLAQNLQHDLRQQAYQHVQRLEMGFFERQRTGNQMSSLGDDINQM